MKEKKIFCPKCDSMVMRHDGISTLKKTTICNKCRKLVTYDPYYCTVAISEPERESLSGIKFW